MFSISQCLSVMMCWQTPEGMGSTTIMVSDCRLLMQSTGIASADVKCRYNMTLHEEKESDLLHGD